MAAIDANSGWLRDSLRRVMPVRVAYRFARGLWRGMSLPQAWSHARDRLYVDAAAKRGAKRITSDYHISSRAGEDEALWRAAAGPWAARNRDAHVDDRRNALAGAILQLAPRNALEIGCNFGANIARILQLEPGVNVMGIDIGMDALRTAEPSVRRSVAAASAYALPVADASFDVVFTSCLLMHLPASDALSALEEIVRASRKYVMLVEYWNEQEARGREFAGYDFRIYNHDCVDWVRARPDVDLLKAAPTPFGGGSNNLRTILLAKRERAAC